MKENETESECANWKGKGDVMHVCRSGTTITDSTFSSVSLAFGGRGGGKSTCIN